MNTLPPLPPITNPQPLVRLWDAQWNLRHVLTPADVIRDITGGRARVSYGADHVLSRWVLEETHDDHLLYMTIDENRQRWIAMLDGWQLRKAGPCPQCPHCQQTILDVDWKTLEVP